MMIAALGGTLYGYELGIVSSIFLLIQHEIHLTVDQMSLLVSATLASSAIATLLAGLTSNWISRKHMMFIASVVFIIGILWVVLSQKYISVLIGRSIQGMAIGIVSLAAPLYLTEVMPPRLRGRGVTIFQLFVTVGLVMASVIGLFFVPGHNWKGMFLTALIPGSIFFVGTMFLIPSPRWLALKGRYDECLSILKLVQDDSRASIEFNDIKKAMTHVKLGNVVKESFFQKKYIIPVVIVCVLAIFNQLTGGYSILQFESYILQKSGLEKDIVIMAGTTVVSILCFIVTLIVIFFIDKFERRDLMVFGITGTVFSLLYCSVVYSLVSFSAIKGLLMLFGIISFIIFYSIGPATILWVLVPELLPSRTRSMGLALAWFFNSLTSASIAMSFVGLGRGIGLGNIFLIFALMTLFYLVMSFFFIPETSGFSLEEIEQGFRKTTFL